MGEQLTLFDEMAVGASPTAGRPRSSHLFEESQQRPAIPLITPVPTISPPPAEPPASPPSPPATNHTPVEKPPITFSRLFNAYDHFVWQLMTMSMIAVLALIGTFIVIGTLMMTVGMFIHEFSSIRIIATGGLWLIITAGVGIWIMRSHWKSFICLLLVVGGGMLAFPRIQELNHQYLHRGQLAIPQIVAAQKAFYQQHGIWAAPSQLPVLHNGSSAARTFGKYVRFVPVNGQCIQIRAAVSYAFPGGGEVTRKVCPPRR